MNETKFTPGPWRLMDSHEHNRDYKVIMGGAPDFNEPRLAHVFTGFYDAALIEAAPDLYEFVALWVRNWEADGWTGHDRLIDTARAALAKARGE